MTLTPVAYIPAWYPSTGGTLDLDGGDLFGLKKLKSVQHSCYVLPAGGREGQTRKHGLVALDDPEQFHGRLGGCRVRLLEHRADQRQQTVVKPPRLFDIALAGRAAEREEVLGQDVCAGEYAPVPSEAADAEKKMVLPREDREAVGTGYYACLLYTSDAADDLLCVDLGGRRIIKKKKTTNEV